MRHAPCSQIVEVSLCLMDRIGSEETMQMRKAWQRAEGERMFDRKELALTMFWRQRKGGEKE